MIRREEIQKVLNGKRVTRIPRALYGAGRWAYRQAGLRVEEIVRDPRAFGHALADIYEGLDTDIVFAGSGLNTFPAESIGGTLAYNEEQAPLLSFPIIETSEDARFFSKPGIQGSPHTLALVEMIAVLRTRLHERFLCVTSWAPFTWGMILCDWNLLKDKTVSDTGFIEEVCELGVRLTQSLCELLVERDLIDGIAVPDGAATLLPIDLYKSVVLPAQKHLFDWARSKGLRTIFHQCGNIAPQLSLYPETGADCISVDASVSISKAYNLYREHTVTAGNVDVINTILATDPPTIHQAVSDCIRNVTDPYFRYILMPSCDLPPDTHRQNVEAFLAAADSQPG